MALQPEPIDDKRVQGILDHARDLARSQAAGLSMLALDKEIWQVLFVLRRWDDTPQTPLSQVAADPLWRSLLRLPQKPLDLNFDLMSAEHYSYARFVAAFYGDPHTETVLKTYFAVKSALSHFKGGEKLLRTSPNHPVLPESDASLRWMSLGVVQGLNDYRAANGGQMGKPWSSRDVVTQNVGTQYQRAKDAAGVRPYAQGAPAADYCAF